MVVQYLCLTLWPHPLVFDYGQEMTIWHIADMGSYALVLTLLLGGVLFAMVRQPAIGFVGIWFFLILAPSSSVVPVVGQPMAEHRMYLPLAAVVTLSVMVTNTLLGRRSGAVFLALAVGLGSLSTRRNQDYRTELSIWNDTLAKRPGNARAHNGLGNALGQVGRIEDAIGQYEQALQIAPDYADAHYNLGCALARVGRNPDAIGQYEQALRINPDYAEAHNNLGDLLMHSGRVTEAIEHLEHAGRIKPDYVNAYNLGVALYQIGKPEDAIEHYREALRIQPNCVEAQYALGIALERVGRIPEAMGHYQQALRIKPGFIPAQNALVRLQARP